MAGSVGLGTGLTEQADEWNLYLAIAGDTPATDQRKRFVEGGATNASRVGLRKYVSPYDRDALMHGITHGVISWASAFLRVCKAGSAIFGCHGTGAGAFPVAWPRGTLYKS